ncbi:MAG: DHH family phosphoesterase, partial [Candidatus Aenigmatarchaeota archaeon]
MKDAVGFLKSIEGSAGIFFHADCDGSCSAALVLALLKNRGLRPKVLAGELDEEFFEAFAKQKVGSVIFLDLAVDQYPELLGPFRKRKVLVIDHHVIHNDLNKMGFIHINPRFKNPELYTSASLVTFDICSKAGLKSRKWIAKLGAVGDRAIKGTEK